MSKSFFNEIQKNTERAHVRTYTRIHVWNIFCYTIQKKRRIRNVNVMAVYANIDPALWSYSKMNTQYCYAFLIQMQHTLFLSIKITRRVKKKTYTDNTDITYTDNTDITSHTLEWLSQICSYEIYTRHIINRHLSNFN